MATPMIQLNIKVTVEEHKRIKLLEKEFSQRDLIILGLQEAEKGGV